MRIIAGAARGRRLSAPPGDTVRPTSDRVREALFSSLAPMVPGASVLDAFAGSGALGLEARSRGAQHVTMIEQDRRALTVLRRNVEAVGLAGVDVVQGDALRMVATGRPVGAPFDLVLLDPPYGLGEEDLAGLLRALVPSLAPGATVVVERAAAAPSPRWPDELQDADERRYGSTRLHRARRSATEASAVSGPEGGDGGGGA